jgi:hypothetical protein
MGMLSEKLNELDNVTFTAVGSDVFFDYNALLDQVYRKFPTGTVKSNHLFFVEDSRSTVMHSVTYNDEDDDDGHIEFNFINNRANR